MKMALITGVGRGIGRALAETFLAEGFGVIGTTTTGSADFSHEHLTLVELDLASRESIDVCVATVAARAVPLDIVINNAGVLLDEHETAPIPEKLRSTLEVNLIGTATLTEGLLPHIAPSGHLIFIDSTAGSLELATQLVSHEPGQYPAYKISKAALNMYMVTLSKRHDAAHLIVSSVHPGWVRTQMGGSDGEISPEEAARDIYTFALSQPETGYFWHKGEKLPW